MKFWKNIFPFILLNIAVSAATVMAVLYFWDQEHPLPPVSETVVAPTEQNNFEASTHQITNTPSPDQAEIAITGVFGVGDINVEYLLLENQSESDVNLLGWSLSGAGQSLTLPNLTLKQNGAVRVYSKLGTDSVIELFWNSDQALWKEGLKISLSSPDGVVRINYTIP